MFDYKNASRPSLPQSLGLRAVKDAKLTKKSKDAGEKLCSRNSGI
jgi:hypothetical protein